MQRIRIPIRPFVRRPDPAPPYLVIRRRNRAAYFVLVEKNGTRRLLHKLTDAELIAQVRRAFTP